MADGGYDPCECVWSHSQAMRRLISLLRSSQGYCTSDECFHDLPGPANASRTGGEDTFFFFMMLWMIFAGAMYFLRPRGLFQRDFTKPSPGRDQEPPPPDNAIM